jgi:hypothetical protein
MTASSAVPVDSSNIEQLHAWDGDEGRYWADNAEHFDRSVAAYHQLLLLAAAIGAGGPATRCRRLLVRTLLALAGFADVELEATTADMWFGNDADDAHRFVLDLIGGMLNGLDDNGRARCRRAPRDDGRPRNAGWSAIQVGGVDHGDDPAVTMSFERNNP